MRPELHGGETILRSGESRGLLLALAGFVCLSCGDAVIKTMAGQWPPMAIAALRYAFGAIGLAVLLGWREGPENFSPPAPRLHLVRGLAVAMATTGFFAAVFVMPLTDATAITFTSPIITGLLAPFVLGEPVRRETWISTIIAFVGVLIVLRPNVLAHGWEALLPLLSALGMSILMMANRAVAGKASPLAMQAYVAVAATPILIVVALAGHFSGIAKFALTWPSWSVIARCALVACSASTAHWLIFLGTTKAGAASVAPMTYVQLLVALTLGWLLFGQLPDTMTLLGAGVIVGAGLLLWWSSRETGKPQKKNARAE